MMARTMDSMVFVIPRAAGERHIVATVHWLARNSAISESPMVNGLKLRAHSPRLYLALGIVISRGRTAEIKKSMAQKFVTATWNAVWVGAVLLPRNPVLLMLIALEKFVCIVVNDYAVGLLVLNILPVQINKWVKAAPEVVEP